MGYKIYDGVKRMLVKLTPTKKGKKCAKYCVVQTALLTFKLYNVLLERARKIGYWFWPSPSFDFLSIVVLNLERINSTSERVKCVY